MLVVGIGASAGGLEAYKAFFSRMSPDNGMAFVLVQHLAPDHESILTTLIGKVTAMTVREAEHGAALEPGHVFVIPPDATLTVVGGRLRVVKPAPARAERRPIDTFMLSLAEDQGENAVCIILSGAGSDGTLGLTAIKEHGGMTMAQAQDGHGAKLGMPSSAAATGLVDHVIPVDEMPGKLVAYRDHLSRVGGRKGPDGTRTDTTTHVKEICAVLEKGIGHDFSQYKQTTLVRRIQRRMQVCQIDKVPDYVARIRQDRGELELLFRDLLIGVTRFFRDPAAFEALEKTVIPKLVAAKEGANDTIRAWVTGCATGEEAYTIAILLLEAVSALPRAPKITVFATDINDAAIAAARAGRFPRASLDGMSPRRVERWFVEEGERYRIAETVRELCVFSVHSLVKDPPFSRLDLVSCRNLLIYFDSDLQERLTPLFHYALRPGGYLFLGAAEGITRQSEFFSVVDKPHRLFKRRDETARGLPDFRGAGRTKDRGTAPPGPLPEADSALERGARRIMDKYAPGHVVIDGRHQILRFVGSTGKYLEPTEGAPSFNLFNMLQRGLRTAVRTALRRATDTQQRVVQENLAIDVDGKNQTINLIVEPIRRASKKALHYVVAFQDVATPAAMRARKSPAKASTSVVRKLEDELEVTKARLQAAIDEIGQSNEDLQSANEEFQSVNEELQSANEELETSKEEMQSINEELQTVNNELIEKNATQHRLNSDLQNFLESTQIATLFLDDELRVRSFTPSLTEIFHLRKGDQGRPITDIAGRFPYRGLEKDVRDVLRTLAVVEREVQVAEEGATFIMRIRPYRTLAKVVDGVVITFVDVSAKKSQEIAQAQLAAIVDSSHDAIIGHTLEGVIASWNISAERMFGLTARQAIGQPLSALPAEGLAEAFNRYLPSLKAGRPIEPFDIKRSGKGAAATYSLTISPVRDGDGHVVTASTIARDVTEQRQFETQRDLLMAELNHRVKNMLTGVLSISRQTIRSAASLDDFSEAFNARIAALAKTHDLLMQRQWRSASLQQILALEISPYNGEGSPRFLVEGKDILLSPKQALALGMAVHELAMNAAKYGALSVPEGSIKIAWDTSKGAEGRLLELRWSESGGPRVGAPPKRGFGSRLIEQGLQGELGGDVRLHFEPGGVRCVMRFPLRSEVE